MYDSIDVCLKLHAIAESRKKEKKKDNVVVQIDLLFDHRPSHSDFQFS